MLLWEVWSGTHPWPGLTPPQLGRVLIQNGQRLPLTNNHTHITPVLKSCFGPPGARLPAAQVRHIIVEPPNQGHILDSIKEGPSEIRTTSINGKMWMKDYVLMHMAIINHITIM